MENLPKEKIKELFTLADYKIEEYEDGVIRLEKTVNLVNLYKSDFFESFKSEKDVMKFICDMEYIRGKQDGEIIERNYIKKRIQNSLGIGSIEDNIS